MRPWAEFLNEKCGYTVRVPRLPGHSRTPEELNRTTYMEWLDKASEELSILERECKKIFVIGFSMGGAIALSLSQREPKRITALILLNPMIHVAFVGPQLAWLVSKFRTFSGSGVHDIKKPGATEYSYDKLPNKAVIELLKLLKIVRRQLHSVSIPTLIFHSREDHTLPESNTRIIFKRISSQEKQRIELLNSYHVAAIDYDAELIFENSRIFIENH